MEPIHIFCASLIFPIVMVVAGICFRNGLPRKVNWWAGYRTPMACKNQDTWVFAHKLLSKIMIPIGFVLILISIVALILTERGTFSYETFQWIAVTQFLVFLAVTFIPTETALRKRFDKQGNKK